MHSQPYTGNKSFAIRNNLNISKSEIEDLHKSLLRMQNINEITPFEFTQFVRGRLFIWVDTLMTKWQVQKLDPKTGMPILLDFCKETINFITYWLKYYQNNYELLTELQNNNQLFLVSIKHAIIASYPELSHMLNLFFKVFSRCDDVFTVFFTYFIKKRIFLWQLVLIQCHQRKRRKKQKPIMHFLGIISIILNKLVPLKLC